MLRTTVLELATTRLLHVEALESPIDGEAAVTPIITAAWEHDTTWIVVGADALSERFFDLRTGTAGAIVQRLVNYRLHLAIVGDVDGHRAASTAFAAFSVEANRGGQLWFVADLEELERRLSR
jgi:hypothetical protein